MRYKTRPCEIEAVEFKRDCFEEIRKFTEGKAKNFRTEKMIDGKSFCEIETLEGDMTATEGDYIIKGLRGEFYPCKPDVFHRKYEEIGR